MKRKYERYRMLYDVEVWVCPNKNMVSVVTFGVGEFAWSPKCVVVLCGSRKMAKQVVESLTEESTKRMIEDLSK